VVVVAVAVMVLVVVVVVVVVLVGFKNHGQDRVARQNADRFASWAARQNGPYAKGKGRGKANTPADTDADTSIADTHADTTNADTSIADTHASKPLVCCVHIRHRMLQITQACVDLCLCDMRHAMFDVQHTPGADLVSTSGSAEGCWQGHL